MLGIELKQSYCQILESVPAVFASDSSFEIFKFISHLAAAVLLLETNNMSQVCQFDMIEI